MICRRRSRLAIVVLGSARDRLASGRSRWWRVADVGVLRARRRASVGCSKDTDCRSRACASTRSASIRTSPRAGDGVRPTRVGAGRRGRAAVRDVRRRCAAHRAARRSGAARRRRTSCGASRSAASSRARRRSAPTARSTSRRTTARSTRSTPTARSEWKFATGDRSWSTPAVAEDGTIYVGSDDDHLYAVDADGKLKWKLRLGACDPKGFGPESSRCDVDGGPTIGPDGTIYVGGDGIHAVWPDGTLRWKLATAEHVASTPAIGADGTVYAGCQDDALYAIAPDGTEDAGRSAPAATSTPRRDRRRRHDLRRQRRPRALRDHARPARSRGRSSPARDIRGGAAIAADGTIYVGSSTARSTRSRRPARSSWKVAAADKIAATPGIATNGTILVGAEDEHLYAIAPDGTLLLAARARRRRRYDAGDRARRHDLRRRRRRASACISISEERTTMTTIDRQAVIDSLSRLVTPGIKLTALADELGARKHDYARAARDPRSTSSRRARCTCCPAARSRSRRAGRAADPHAKPVPTRPSRAADEDARRRAKPRDRATSRRKRRRSAQAPCRTRASARRPARAAARGRTTAETGEIRTGRGAGHDRAHDRSSRAAASRRRAPPVATIRRRRSIGRITVHPAGYGFVATEAGETVFVPAKYRGTSLDGDRVAVDTWPGVRGTEGRVVEVLARGRARLTGILRRVGRARLPRARRSADRGGLRPGRRRGRADRQGRRRGRHRDHALPRRRAPRARRQAAQGARRSRGSAHRDREDPRVRGDPDRVPRRGDRAGEGAPRRSSAPTDLADRIDLRDRRFATIDPETARDFDDALCIEDGPHGGPRVWVAVADVSHYVRWGDALDKRGRDPRRLGVPAGSRDPDAAAPAVGAASARSTRSSIAARWSCGSTTPTTASSPTSATRPR